MSSFRNAKKLQQVHRERHQNEARAHLGPMEKKKDYKIRAADQSAKKKLLKKLHKRALEKNPDEFYFHMNGLHKEKAVVKEFTSKNVRTDLTYVKFRRTMERKKIDKLRAHLHFLEPSGEDEPETQNTHLLFVDSDEEGQSRTPAELLNTHPDLMSRRFNRLTLEQLQQMPEAQIYQKEDLKVASSSKAKSYKELCKRLERDDKLRLLQEKLESKLQLMKYEEQKNSSSFKLPQPKLEKKGTETSAPVYKFPYIRKR
ncbi:Small-subunit processome Utp11 [Trinorchestia longiramus]|nr:Small-subunit processome Utp11 [Trinorchestia longiramus]